MKFTTGVGLLLLLFNIGAFLNSYAQEVPPFVYDVENTGADCTMPPLLSFADLPIVEPLTDPFEWSDGSGRDTAFTSWEHRRNEIKAEIENYEIGLKPDRPDTISASYSNDTLRVFVTENGKTLTLTSRIILPEGTGPFPGVIGVNFGMITLPDSIFTNRDIAIISFNHNDASIYNTPSLSDPYYKLYPELYGNSGQYSAWAWGVSRLIDGLELVQGDLPIDLEHLAINGCSYAGKLAIFAGAYDERIALTLAQESGGGGAAAWRVSETLEGVETLGNTSHVWFKESMFQFAGDNVSKLPHDHHELLAMIAPRAALITGNPSYVWLADESGYVSCVAAKKVWENFGISDRFGYSIIADHPHCQVPEVQIPEIVAFVDKFLLGDTLANTDVTTNPYNYVIPEYWTVWWGTGEPEFPILDRGESEEVWFEAECANVGPAWNVRLDTAASNESYVIPKPGLTSISHAPADSGAAIYFPFTVNTDTTFYIFGRVNCPTANSDSYWLKVDDRAFIKVYGFVSDGWEWKEMTSFNLTAGEHTLAIAYCREGIKLDKICISVFGYPPGEKGEPAEFICEADTTTQPYNPPQSLDVTNTDDTYALGQNYPNPFNNKTVITFEIPQGAYVSLKVYSLLGEEIAELAGKECAAGKHKVEFDARNLSQGIYFYVIRVDKYLANRRMTIQNK